MVIRLTDLHVEINFEVHMLLNFAFFDLLVLFLLEADGERTDEVLDVDGLVLAVPRVLVQTLRVDVHFNILIILFKKRFQY